MRPTVHRLNVLIQPALIVTLFVGVGGCARSGAAPGTPMSFVPPPRAEQVQPLDPDMLNSAMTIILQASQHPDPRVRGGAIEAIADAPRDLRLLSRVISALDDPEPVVRYSAALTVGQLRLREAYLPVLRRADDIDPNVQVAIRYALHQLGDRRRSAELLQFARSLDGSVRASTAMVFGLIGERSAIETLRRMQSDPEPLVQLAVGEAMWRLGDDRGLSTLIEFSLSRFADDQVYAVVAIGQARNPAIASELVARMQTALFPQMRLAAARALGMVGSDRGMVAAVVATQSPDWMIRDLAARALGSIARTDAQDLLRQLMEDPDERVRRSAAAAVLQLHNTRGPQSASTSR